MFVEWPQYAEIQDCKDKFNNFHFIDNKNSLRIATLTSVCDKLKEDNDRIQGENERLLSQIKVRKWKIIESNKGEWIMEREKF